MADPNTETTTVGVGGGSPMYIGSSATDTITFFGGTPVAQQATVATVTTTASTTSVPFGYTTSTQADAIVTAINAVIARLDAYNLIA